MFHNSRIIRISSQKGYLLFYGAWGIMRIFGGPRTFLLDFGDHKLIFDFVFFFSLGGGGGLRTSFWNFGTTKFQNSNNPHSPLSHKLVKPPKERMKIMIIAIMIYPYNFIQQKYTDEHMHHQHNETVNFHFVFK